MSNTRAQRRAALLGRFREVAAERLQRVGAGWVRLEQAPEDVAEAEEVLRELHSLKGEARAMGFPHASELTHHLESLVVNARARGFALDREDRRLILTAVDALAAMVQEAPGAEPPPTHAELGARLQAAASALMPTEAPAEAGSGRAPGGADTSSVEAEKVGPAPAEDTRRPAPAAPRAAVPSTPVRLAGATLRVRAERVEGLSDSAAELLTAESRNAFLIQELLGTLRTLETQVARPDLRPFRAEVQGLSRLVTRLEEGLYRQRLRTEALDRNVRELRLIPAINLLSHFERMVRDLADEQGKEAWLRIEGGEVEADRRVLEQLEEPLLHLLRNSVDHGIELPSVRESRGKPRRGTLRMSLNTGGGELRVVVEDDGAGLVPEALRERAVARGLINAAAGMALSSDQCLQLIFLPGFSTRETASQLSGRGVGMDVVKQRVESLGGRVHLRSVAGHGLRVEMVVPITLSLTRALVVRAGPYLCALPAVSIMSIQRLADLQQVETPEGSAIRWENDVLPLATLEEVLTRGGEPASGLGVALLLRAGARRCALLVAEAGHEAEVLVRGLEPPLHRIRMFAGAAQLSNGELALVPQVSELVEHAWRRKSRDSERRLRRPAELRILLVDDSAILRASLESMVKSLGYQVLTAGDGLEGLAVLDQEVVDLVITDLQMPRMDGLGLLRRIRANPRWRELPLMVLSSLGSPEDRARCVEAGANAHLTKNELSESALAEAIHRLLG